MNGPSKRSFWREGEPFSQRLSATFGHNGNTITGRWAIAEDGMTDFDIVLRRVGSA